MDPVTTICAILLWSCNSLSYRLFCLIVLVYSYALQIEDHFEIQFIDFFFKTVTDTSSLYSTAVLTDSRTRPNRYALKVQLKVEKLKSFQPCYPNMYGTIISLRKKFPQLLWKGSYVELSNRKARLWVWAIPEAEMAAD